MRRTPQIVLIVSFILFSWLAFMVAHEFGHALAAWLTGGSVDLMILHPFQISWTTFARNPHPQLVAWGGPFFGALLPCVFLIAALGLRSPGLYLFRFFAGFCVIANGLYLIVDSFGRGGDGGTLIRHGAPAMGASDVWYCNGASGFLAVAWTRAIFWPQAGEWKG